MSYWDVNGFLFFGGVLAAVLMVLSAFYIGPFALLLCPVGVGLVYASLRPAQNSNVEKP